MARITVRRRWVRARRANEQTHEMLFRCGQQDFQTSRTAKQKEVRMRRCFGTSSGRPSLATSFTSAVDVRHVPAMTEMRLQTSLGRYRAETI